MGGVAVNALELAPISVKDARRVVARWHSHHGAPRGGLIASSVVRGDDVVCVAILGRPSATRLGNLARRIGEVTRVASNGTPKAAVMCLRALTEAALRLGYRRLVSYTLLGEAGTLYRSAGWVVAGLVEASDAWHSRPGRTIMQGGPKVRWEAGPDARADGAAALVAGMCVGRVEIPARRETLPLFARCA